MDCFSPMAYAKAKGDFVDSNLKPLQRLVALIVDISGSLRTNPDNGVQGFWLWVPVTRESYWDRSVLILECSSDLIKICMRFHWNQM